MAITITSDRNLYSRKEVDESGPAIALCRSRVGQLVTINSTSSADSFFKELTKTVTRAPLSSHQCSLPNGRNRSTCHKKSKRFLLNCGHSHTYIPCFHVGRSHMHLCSVIHVFPCTLLTCLVIYKFQDSVCRQLPVRPSCRRRLVLNLVAPLESRFRAFIHTLPNITHLVNYHNGPSTSTRLECAYRPC